MTTQTAHFYAKVSERNLKISAIITPSASLQANSILAQGGSAADSKSKNYDFYVNELVERTNLEMNPISSSAALVASVMLDPEFTTRVLTISAGHLPSITATALDDDSSDLRANVCLARNDFGRVLSTNSVKRLEALVLGTGKHSELLDLLQFSEAAGYQSVSFDVDALQLPAALGFPVFERCS